MHNSSQFSEITLRPHHGLCFQFYEGKGYSEDFTDHMGSIIYKLEEAPSSPLTLRSQTDLVCANCPNNEEGSCTSPEKVLRYDEEVLKACDLSEGDTLSYDSFISLVRNRIIDTGLRSTICGDCSWDYICREKEQILRAITRITEMEAILDHANSLLNQEDFSRKALTDYLPQIKRLEEYYEGPLWKEDFFLDEQGKLPFDLKRGVLSEDAIYDLLDRVKES
jgi:hypothetical protein